MPAYHHRRCFGRGDDILSKHHITNKAKESIECAIAGDNLDPFARCVQRSQCRYRFRRAASLVRYRMRPLFCAVAPFYRMGTTFPGTYRFIHTIPPFRPRAKISFPFVSSFGRALPSASIGALPDCQTPYAPFHNSSFRECIFGSRRSNAFNAGETLVAKGVYCKVRSRFSGHVPHVFFWMES
jgi:hypothetical protein